MLIFVIGLSQTYQQEDKLKVENKMLQEEIAELQSRLNIAEREGNNKVLVKKYLELKDKVQHDETTIKVIFNYYQQLI